MHSSMTCVEVDDSFVFFLTLYQKLLWTNLSLILMKQQIKALGEDVDHFMES